MKAKIFSLLAVFFAFVVCSFGVPKTPEKKPPKFKIEKSEAKTILETEKAGGIIFDDGGGGTQKVVIQDSDYKIQTINPSNAGSARETNPYVPYAVDYRSINIRRLLHPPLTSIHLRE